MNDPEHSKPGEPFSAIEELAHISKCAIDSLVKNDKDMHRMEQRLEMLSAEIQLKDSELRKQEAEIDSLRSENENLKLQVSQLQRQLDEHALPNEPHGQGLSADDIANLQRTLLQSAKKSSDATVPDGPPPFMVADLDNPRTRRRGKPDWDGLKARLARNNKLSELNNEITFNILERLFQQGIIDENFHIRKRFSDNVACHLAMSMRSRIQTESRWAPFETIFGRQNLRTYQNRRLSATDHRYCSHIDDIINSIV